MHIDVFRQRYGEVKFYPMHKRDKKELKSWAKEMLEKYTDEKDQEFFKKFEHINKWAYVENFNGKTAIFPMAGDEVLADEECDMMPHWDVCPYHPEEYIQYMLDGELVKPYCEVEGMFNISEDCLAVVVDFNEFDLEKGKRVASHQAKHMGYPVFAGTGQKIVGGKAQPRMFFFFMKL